MIIECLIILALVVAILFIYMFRKNEEHEGHVLMIIPFIFLPALNVLAYFFSGYVRLILPFDTLITNIIINSIAVLISGIFAGAGLSKLKTKSTKITYSTIVALYDIILSCILISDLCQRMGLMPDHGGIGIYEKKGFCHVDVRAKKARWNG